MEVPDNTNITGLDTAHTWNKVLDKRCTACRLRDTPCQEQKLRMVSFVLSQ